MIARREPLAAPVDFVAASIREAPEETTPFRHLRLRDVFHAGRQFLLNELRRGRRRQPPPLTGRRAAG